MIDIQRVCSALLIMTLLAACGPATQEAERPPPPAVEDTAFGDMVGTMDKARGVETTIQQNKEALDRAIDSQSEATGDQ